MKFLKGFLSFIIGVVLLSLILSLSILITTQSFIEKEVITTAVKETISAQMDTEDITPAQKDLFDKLLKDKESNNIINRIVQNYISYKTDENYKVSKTDYELIVNFLVKYKDELNVVNETDYSEEEIRNILNYEDLQTVANDMFKSFEQEGTTDSINEFLNFYTTITSKNNKILMASGILLCILLLMLVNWSLTKWLIVTAIDLILSGLNIGSVVIFYKLFVKNAQMDENLERILTNLNVSKFAYVALLEIALGILLIVLHSTLKKKEEPKQKKES